MLHTILDSPFFKAKYPFSGVPGNLLNKAVEQVKKNLFVCGPAGILFVLFHGGQIMTNFIVIGVIDINRFCFETTWTNFGVFLLKDLPLAYVLGHV